MIKATVYNSIDPSPQFDMLTEKFLQDLASATEISANGADGRPARTFLLA
jgi:hypothetical protein